MVMEMDKIQVVVEKSLPEGAHIRNSSCRGESRYFILNMCDCEDCGFVTWRGVVTAQVEGFGKGKDGFGIHYFAKTGVGGIPEGAAPREASAHGTRVVAFELDALSRPN